MSVELVRTLGNKYNVELLTAAAEPLSAKELSEAVDVPIATCYRRIEELTETGLLEHHDRVLTDERQRESVYRRQVESVSVEFGGEELSVDQVERTGTKNKLDDVWRTLSDPD